MEVLDSELQDLSSELGGLCFMLCFGFWFPNSEVQVVDSQLARLHIPALGFEFEARQVGHFARGQAESLLCLLPGM